MGYALFTARKMSLQAKVNQYNLKLMQLANKETELTNKTTLRQTLNNSVDKAQSTANLACNIGDLFTGGATSAVAGVANFAIDTIQSKSDEAYQTKIEYIVKRSTKRIATSRKSRTKCNQECNSAIRWLVYGLYKKSLTNNEALFLKGL